RGKVEARPVVKHKLCRLALSRHKIRPVQEFNRFVQPEVLFGMLHFCKRSLDGCPFNQFCQRLDHSLGGMMNSNQMKIEDAQCMSDDKWPQLPPGPIDKFKYLPIHINTTKTIGCKIAVLIMKVC